MARIAASGATATAVTVTPPRDRLPTPATARHGSPTSPGAARTDAAVR